MRKSPTHIIIKASIKPMNNIDLEIMVGKLDGNTIWRVKNRYVKNDSTREATKHPIATKMKI